MFATSFVLGYHGCDAKVGEKILGSSDHVSPSGNAYDWLGAGAYFWENSPKRVLVPIPVMALERLAQEICWPSCIVQIPWTKRKDSRAVRLGSD